jgi:pilus assembly protein Flp/PilA
MMFWKTIESIEREDEGQALVEYGLILFLVSVAIVAVLGLLTGQLQVVFQAVIAALGG